MDHSTLSTLLAGSAVLAFILTMVGADLGAADVITIRALCAVAVLGTATATVVLRARGLV
jgi:hypothetical protein